MTKVRVELYGGLDFIASRCVGVGWIDLDDLCNSIGNLEGGSEKRNGCVGVNQVVGKHVGCF